MATKGYTIRAIRYIGISPQYGCLTCILETLNREGVWCTATDSAAVFQTPFLAARWFRLTSTACRGTNIYIEGPRGGRYSITGGKP